MVSKGARVDQRTTSQAVPDSGADLPRTEARGVHGGTVPLPGLGIEAGPGGQRDRLAAGKARERAGGGGDGASGHSARAESPGGREDQRRWTAAGTRGFR